MLAPVQPDELDAVIAYLGVLGGREDHADWCVVRKNRLFMWRKMIFIYFHEVKLKMDLRILDVKFGT